MCKQRDCHRPRRREPSLLARLAPLPSGQFEWINAIIAGPNCESMYTRHVTGGAASFNRTHQTISSLLPLIIVMLKRSRRLARPSALVRCKMSTRQDCQSDGHFRRKRFSTEGVSRFNKVGKETLINRHREWPPRIGNDGVLEGGIIRFPATRPLKASNSAGKLQVGQFLKGHLEYCP